MKTRISERAHALGFDAVGFASPNAIAHAPSGLMEFLHSNHHGTMHWMETRSHQRGSPKTLWPEVKSILVVGHNYGPETNPMERLAHKDKGNISVYALNKDYHDVIKKKLRFLARWIVEEFSCEVKLFVDTAPVMEKPLAEAAGLGWQGKHTCLVSREFGSWLFLGSIFLSCDMSEAHGHRIPASTARDPAPPLRGSQDLCGTCTKCLDICPTQAFTGPGKLDARKCISYLTIEHKGPIPHQYRKAIGNRIYGCDDCLAVCPWNKFAKTAQESAYHARTELDLPPLSELARLDDENFRKLFAKSPIKRIGRDKFVSNVCIAIGNSGDKTLKKSINHLINDDSNLICEAATWAKNQR